MISIDSIKRVSTLNDFKEALGYGFKSVVLVGSASVSLSDRDSQIFSGLDKPIFVYFNHASLSSELQCYYPKDYGEVLFLRAGGGNLHGVDVDGKMWFKPKDRKSFSGCFVINPPKNFFIEDCSNAFLVGGELYESVRRDYPENESGSISPSTGYFAEKMLRQLLEEALESDGVIYTVGFGLDSSVQKSATHNLPFEQEEQKRKFNSGALFSLGEILKARVPENKRVRPN